MHPRRVLFVARHGETDWNVAGRWQGHTDVPLNETGRRQAAELAEALREHGVVAVVTSDLSRARETGAIVAAALGARVAYADTGVPGLRERTFGVFEGLTRDECEAQHPEAWRAWIERRVAPGGAESQEELAKRMLASIDRVAAEIAAEGATLIVSHGGSVRAMLAAATGEMPALVGNGAVWRIEWEGGKVVGAREMRGAPRGG